MEIDILNDLYGAIGALESTISQLESMNTRTNNQLYEDLKYYKILLNRAKKAYEKLRLK